LVSEVPYLGKGKQRRFKLKAQMNAINRALGNSRGSFERFLEQFEESQAD